MVADPGYRIRTKAHTRVHLEYSAWMILRSYGEESVERRGVSHRLEYFPT